MRCARCMTMTQIKLTPQSSDYTRDIVLCQQKILNKIFHQEFNYIKTNKFFFFVVVAFQSNVLQRCR